MDSRRIKIGVVGTGHWGEKHALVYSRIPGVDLVGVSDIDREKGASLARRLDTAFFSEPDELFKRVDGVSLVVPTTSHHELAKRALAAGVDILVEKPITRTLAEADELIELAAGNKRIIQVGHLERYNPVFIELKRSIEKPRFIESHRLAEFRPLSQDISVVLDLMTHDLDLVLDLVGETPVSVEAVGVPVITDKVDITNARLTFPGGCIANLTASRVSRKKVRKFRVFEINNYYSADLAGGTMDIIRRSEAAGPKGDSQSLEGERRELGPIHPLDDELADFARNIRDRRRPRVDGLAGREVLRVALEVLRGMNG